jgi:uncharacterized protein YdhG (YjbR/CyaY superfamily)
MTPKRPTVDDYIAAAAPPARVLLEAMRRTIREAAPHAAETISYKMPAFTFHGVLVYYAAFTNHIGFYPTASGIRAFEAELAAYAHAKGSVRFPMDLPLPLDLVTRIVKSRVAENLARAKTGKRTRSAPDR